MKNKLPVAKRLTDDEYVCFLETYTAHNRGMGLAERTQYNLSEVVKVERGDNCLHVHYRNSDWWHYTPQRTWY